MAETQKPESGKTWKEVNKEHFDSLSKDYFQIPWIRKLHQDIIDFLMENRTWIGIPETARYDNGSGIKVLDFACGNGILSLCLAPYAAELRGIDISSTMVQRYNEAAVENGLGPERMRAVEADIVSGDASLAVVAGSEFSGFNLALVSMVLHHIDDAGAALKAITERLAPGGTILVIDWKTPTCSAHPHGHDHSKSVATEGLRTVVHHGFAEKEMLDMFSEAGIKNGEMRLNPTLSDMPSGLGRQQVFYAVGRKPEA